MMHWYTATWALINQHFPYITRQNGILVYLFFLYSHDVMCFSEDSIFVIVLIPQLQPFNSVIQLIYIYWDLQENEVSF